MLPRLHELLKSPLAQRPVEFYIDKVQFGLRRHILFFWGLQLPSPQCFPHLRCSWREEQQVSAYTVLRQTDLQPRRCRWWCGSVLLPPPCLTFNYPRSCECSTDLFVPLAWDKRAILWAGKMGTACRFRCGRTRREGLWAEPLSVFVPHSKEIQGFNNLGCNRMANQIASLDLGVIKSNYFSINRPRPIKMIWDSMITRLFISKERLESMFGLISRFWCWRTPKYHVLHKYVGLCSLSRSYRHMLILLSTYNCCMSVLWH